MLKIFQYSLAILFLFTNAHSSPNKILAATYKNKMIKRPVIILDAGHGGLDKGAKIRYPYVEEKRLALSAILLTKKYLEQLGYKTILTRSKDYFVSLNQFKHIFSVACTA